MIRLQEDKFDHLDKKDKVRPTLMLMAETMTDK